MGSGWFFWLILVGFLAFSWMDGVVVWGWSVRGRRGGAFIELDAKESLRYAFEAMKTDFEELCCHDPCLKRHFCFKKWTVTGIRLAVLSC